MCSITYFTLVAFCDHTDLDPKRKRPEVTTIPMTINKSMTTKQTPATF